MRLGVDAKADTHHGFFANVPASLRATCAALGDPHSPFAQVAAAAGGVYHALGLSQGGLMARGLAQLCPDVPGVPRLTRLISVGAPQTGVIHMPACSASLDSWACRAASVALKAGAYSEWAQSTIVQAQYFRTPNRDTYVVGNRVLPLLNNELSEGEGGYDAEIAARYRERMSHLDTLVLIKFSRDQMVTPGEASWFGTPMEGGNGNEDEDEDETSGVVVVPLKEHASYKEDWLGLRSLAATGGLVLLEVEGRHLEFNVATLREWATTYLVAS